MNVTDSDTEGVTLTYSIDHRYSNLSLYLIVKDVIHTDYLNIQFIIDEMYSGVMQYLEIYHSIIMEIIKLKNENIRILYLSISL